MESTPFPHNPDHSPFSPSGSNGAAAGTPGESLNGAPNTGPMPGGPSDSNASTAPPSSPPSSRYTAMAHDAVDQMAAMAGRFAGSSTKAMESSTAVLKEKPLTAVGVALALGLLLGALIAR